MKTTTTTTPAAIVAEDGTEFASAYDAQQAGYAKCECCGEWVPVDDGETTQDGAFFCSLDCAHDWDYEYCETCGELFDAGTGVVFSNSHGDFFCFCDKDCAERAGFSQCEACGEWVPANKITETVDGSLCAACAVDYVYCENCGDYVHVDNARCDNSGYWYCDDCWEDDEYSHGYLREYGYEPPLEFFGTSDEHAFMGVELETDKGNNQDDYVEALAGTSYYSRNMFSMTEDGSLICGVEVTSQPMTLEEHVSNGFWRMVHDTALEHGFKSHDAHTCGLHIHIDRRFFGKSRQWQEICGTELAFVLERFESEFTKFARRENNDWCHYHICDSVKKRRTKEFMPTKDIKTKAELYKNEYGWSHSRALNMQHSTTFEFRIFRGTLKLETLFASLALVDGLCRTVRDNAPSRVEKMTWHELMREVLANVSNTEAQTHLGNYLVAKDLI